MKVLLKNIDTLHRLGDGQVQPKTGEDLKNTAPLSNAWVWIEGEKIFAIGTGVCPQEKEAQKTIDCKGKMVLPGFVDSHTHLIFARGREEEFVDKIKGLSYAEIAAKGGGILNSARKLQECSDEELLQSALLRIAEIQKTGTTTVEIKSGYGLSVKDELRMLRIARQIGNLGNITVKTTLLGAHALQEAYKGKSQQWVDIVVEEMIPQAAAEKLVDFVDVFCETNYFSVEDSIRIMQAGEKQGLKSKIHVNQFTAIGGIQAAIENRALSVDHLEICRPEDILALRHSGTLATLLPGCSFYLDIPFAPARQLIEAGAKINLASDFNPGSSPSGSMPFMMALACLRMKLLPEEALNCLTFNAACALDLLAEKGSIEVGKDADLIITRKMENLAQIAYYHSQNPVETLIHKGKIVVEN